MEPEEFKRLFTDIFGWRGEPSSADFVVLWPTVDRDWELDREISMYYDKLYLEEIGIRV